MKRFVQKGLLSILQVEHMNTVLTVYEIIYKSYEVKLYVAPFIPFAALNAILLFSILEVRVPFKIKFNNTQYNLFLNVCFEFYEIENYRTYLLYSINALIFTKILIPLLLRRHRFA